VAALIHEHFQARRGRAERELGRVRYFGWRSFLVGLVFLGLNARFRTARPRTQRLRRKQHPDKETLRHIWMAADAEDFWAAFSLSPERTALAAGSALAAIAKDKRAAGSTAGLV
jgi:hypothetical protein